MEQSAVKQTANAWIAIDHGLATDPALAPYILVLKGERVLYQAIATDDWVLILNTSGQITRVGRVMRLRSNSETTSLYFDKVLAVESPVPFVKTGLVSPTGRISRVQWTEFAEALPKALDLTVADVPLIKSEAYVRELLQLAIMDDLLGPAGGPEEFIVDMGVRDRYLVGKLAPMENAERGEDWVPAEKGDEDEPSDLEPKAKGKKIDSPLLSGSGDSDADEEVDAASNQSLAPSSLGFTFCVDGNIESLEVVVSWGRYERVASDDHDHTKLIKDKLVKAKVWKRAPSGGVFSLAMTPGVVSPIAPDANSPEVRVQGTIRSPNDKGDRLVTLFLVNGQVEPDENRDTAWVFQPEIVVRAEAGSAITDIFRRRPALDADASAEDDEDLRERLALEMIYRDRVEFAVGHGVAVHATTGSVPFRALELRTVVMPQYEVAVTETPGLDPQDRPAMRKMTADGLLDMQTLSASVTGDSMT